MTILEKIVKVAKLEEVAENCTDQNCNSIMEILLHKANRDNNVAATLMNIYLECNDKESFNKIPENSPASVGSGMNPVFLYVKSFFLRNLSYLSQKDIYEKGEKADATESI